MKLLGASIFFGSGLLVGLALGVWGTSGKRVAPHEHLASQTSTTLPQEETQQQELLTERDHWKSEAEKFKKWAEEVHQLRSDVSRLNSELVALRQQQSAEPPAAAKSTGGGKVVVSFADAPASIQAAIIREIRTAAMDRIQISADKGQTEFLVKGKTEDNRGFAMRLDSQGTVIIKDMQIATESIPPDVGAAAQRSFGDLVMNEASELVLGDDRLYELRAKTPDESVQIRIRADGRLVGYSVWPKEGQTKE